jgi:hypothetical protein
MVYDLGYTFTDLDALIISFLEEAVKIDNYYAYALSQELIKKVTFQLKQHAKTIAKTATNSPVEPICGRRGTTCKAVVHGSSST